MKIYTYTWFSILLMAILFINTKVSYAQTDSTKFLTRVLPDSLKLPLNMDAAYNRPFLSAGKLPIAIGGYLEANTQYTQTDGVSDGFSFQARRFTLFFSSTIAHKIKFLSELEFEDGNKEINIEFAAMDIEFHQLVNMRGGIIMNPIGAFNQNHDGPRWDFVDRPLVSTTIIPSTLSNAGFGLHGKYFYKRWILGYEAYLTNGFNDDIISNTDNRTSLAASKSDRNRFEESNSGQPMFTGKIAVRNRKIGEFGISYLTGIYNKWKVDDLVLDKKRSASIVAFDYSTSLFKNRLNITGEIAHVLVDVPETYSQQFGSKQFGTYVDVIATVLQRAMLGWKNAKLNLGLRVEYADYNLGTFNETGRNIADDVWAFVPSVAFRPVATTVLRFNYRYQLQQDILGNPAAKTGIIQFGFSTYF